jgi:hypothetical protein
VGAPTTGVPTAGVPQTTAQVVTCAVGPIYTLEAIDYSVSVINNTSRLPQFGFPKTVNSILGLPADAYTRRASVVYDAGNDRYLMIVDQSDSYGQPLAEWIAISRSGDPTQSWKVFRISAQ